MTQGPLAGVTVIDLTRVLAGPYCTMMLAELGARVIKVENPQGGDDSRHFEPFFEEVSAYFASLNRGKESIALNLKNADDQKLFRNMIRKGDVLVENYRPGTLDRLGLGYEQLKLVNPRLIYAAVSGFGHTGPWSAKPAYDLIVQALGGLMSLTGRPEHGPTKAGTSIGDITGGMFTLAGVLAALYQRQQTDKGAKVDVSMLDGQIAILESAVARYTTSGATPRAQGNRHPSICPFEAYQASDRALIIAAGNDALFEKLCLALAIPALLTDPRFASNRARLQHADELKDIIEGILGGRPAQHWVDVLEAAGIPSSLIQTVPDAVNHPQVQARNMIVQAGNLRMAGNPIKMDTLPDPHTRTPAPGLDADGAALRREFGGSSR